MFVKYDYDINKRFPDNLPTPKHPYRYHFVDRYYKSDNIANGKERQTFKIFYDFYNKLCQHIFDLNLNLRENTDIFPIVCNEMQNSATIAIALSRLTPYVVSELNLHCENTESSQKKEDRNLKHRRVDFWCS